MTETFRAVSTLVLKSVDDDERIIEGVASHAAPDLAGDIIEPKGASYLLPMPLLMQHDRNRPVGQVRAVRVSDSEIKIRARIAKDSGLDYVEDAWKQIKAGLVKGLSIGAQPLKAEPILDNHGRRTGMHYTAWRWHELSAVTLPMNARASIEMVRNHDTSWTAPSLAADRDEMDDRRNLDGWLFALDQLDPPADTADATRARRSRDGKHPARAR